MTATLDGVRVVEVSRNPATRYCGLLFALSGAEVTRFRPDSDRTATPRGGSSLTPLDAYLDHQKDVRASRHEVNGLGGELRERLDTADVLIADPDFDWPNVPNGLRPALSGTVDGFGSSGPRAHWDAPEIVLVAVGGAANYTRAPSGQPVYGFGRRFQYLAGQHLFITLSSAIGSSVQGRLFPMFRVSAAETVVALLPYATTQYAYNGTTTTVEQSGPRFLSPCRDGYLCVYAGGPWSDLARLLGDLVGPDDDRFVGFGRRCAHASELESLVDRWSAARTVDAAIADANDCSVAVAPCYSVDDVLADKTLRDNGLMTSTRFGSNEGTIPGLPYRVRTEVR